MKKILFCKVFGIGNAVMAVPALKALRELYPDALIDVMIGSTRDDVGAMDVFKRLLRDPHADMYGRSIPVIDHLYYDSTTTEEYDLAILSIPFDGRWRNGVHFRAKQVMDGRTRPDPSTTGLVSWRNHEVIYQLENVRTLGWSGHVPSCQFISDEQLKKLEDGESYRKKIYLGVGYKKDAAGFWKVKHWGNESYIELVKKILAGDPEVKIYATGDVQDLQHSLGPIIRGVNDPRFVVLTNMPSLYHCFEVVASCGTYVGNDTGMMHVAASCDRWVTAVFNLENSITKARPFCRSNKVFDGSKAPVTVDEMYWGIPSYIRHPIP